MSKLDTFTRRTFVLGAGFSAAARFPLVRGLRGNVINFIQNNPGPSWQADLTPGAKGFKSGQFYEGLAAADPSGRLGFEELLIELDKFSGRSMHPANRTRTILEFACARLFWQIQMRLSALPSCYQNFAAWLDFPYGMPKNSVISFNWDLVVEQALEEKHVNWFYERVTNNSVAVLKPHGSINWSNHRGSGAVADHTEAWREVAPGSTLDYPAEVLQDPFPHGVNENFRYVIFPGSPAIGEFPPETRPIWDLAVRVLSKSDAVVFLGYSLPTYDGLAAEWLSEYCRGKTIEVYNPNPNDLGRFKKLFGSAAECVPETFEKCMYGATQPVEQMA